MALYGVDLNNLESAILERRGPVAVITLNRPEGANSLNTAIHRDVVACFHEINTNDEIRAAVITGTGKFFCAGRDLKEYVGTYGEGAQKLRPIDDPDHEMFSTLANHYHVQKPLIGAVNGPAVGGGLEIVLMCDMVVMAEDTYLADLHAKVNVGGMTSLNTFLPPMIARELSMTDRRLTAQEAHMWGIANYVVDKDKVVDKAIELAEATAGMGPDSITRLKEGSIELQIRSGTLWTGDFVERRRKEARERAAEVASDHDLMEGMRAFTEKREAKYERTGG